MADALVSDTFSELALIIAAADEEMGLAISAFDEQLAAIRQRTLVAFNEAQQRLTDLMKQRAEDHANWTPQKIVHPASLNATVST